MKGRNPKRLWVLDADLSAAFDRIDHDHLMTMLGKFPARGLIRGWLKAGVIDREMAARMSGTTFASCTPNATAGITLATAKGPDNPADLRSPWGLLEPDAGKARTSGSEGAGDQQWSPATRPHLTIERIMPSFA